MISNIMYFTLWFLVWSALRPQRGVQDLVLWVLVSLFITFMTKDLAAQVGEKKDSRRYSLLAMPGIFAWLLYYIFIFLWECLKANIDVAYRVLHPDMPIRPGTIKIKTTLKSDAGLTFLANSLTLTPGNTTVDVDKAAGVLYVHRLYIKDEHRGYIPAAQKFENILRRIFE